MGKTLIIGQSGGPTSVINASLVGAVKEALKHEENVMGVVISGAGPAILVISYGNNLDKIRETVSNVWLDLNVKSKILTLQVEENGAYVID